MKNQVNSNNIKYTTFSTSMIAALALMCIALLLSGCGIKPSHVEPPNGAENSTFPNVYPNPETDPQPSPQPGLDQKDELLRKKDAL